MSRKSEVVVLDVLMKNEAKYSDMLDIMLKMQEARVSREELPP